MFSLLYFCVIHYKTNKLAKQKRKNKSHFLESVLLQLLTTTTIFFNSFFPFPLNNYALSPFFFFFFWIILPIKLKSAGLLVLLVASLYTYHH